MVFSLIVSLVIAILAVFFALENTMTVTVSFFGIAVRGSLALILLIVLGAGILIVVLIMAPGRIKSGLSDARHRKKIGALEASLDERKAKLVDAEMPRDDVLPD